ncbi:quinol monooxygenase YgiN [Paenibacillus phyllosphaerae]|uniref:Quinol monooxygenase YgiN n=1 Tax=Paenibacillus phyllosphaerae TaxID=274593 RepID=A0A7W5FQE5_9BACL|nr:antibiotic biosynthesis monooxygenase [Paenibacillus phyllosphaerae]MBB3112949.1 quinol monooxygenase YgiN [Paenibacillus phyllosphaerae]
MQKFSMVAKFTAKAGERDTLANILLEAAHAMHAIPACETYVVHLSETEPDVLWVTEMWTSAEAHAASLAQPETRAAIAQAMPLIAGVDGTRLRPVGGKGFQLDDTAH